jgi:hypothetical protein
MQIVAAIVVGVAVAACSDDSPTVPSSLEPQFLIAAGTPVTCDFQNLRTKAAPAYFKNGSTTLRTVKELIQDMESEGQGTDNARDKGFQIFEIIASQIEAGSSHIDGTAEDGSDFVNKTLACMEPEPYVAVDFTGALDADGGAFCVRGGPNDDPSACVTFDGFSGLSPAAASSFPTWFGGRRLVHASPLTLITTCPIGAAVFCSNEIIIGGEYEWSTVPTAALNGKGVVGMCIPNPDDNPVNRVQHREEGYAATILLLADAFFLPTSCDEELGQSSSLLRLARSVFDWASPRPLYASALKLGGGTGGTIGDFSKFAVVFAGAVNLTFTTQPVDGFLNQTLEDVVVQALGNGDTPYIDLEITLSIIGNSSVKATLSGLTDPMPPGFGQCTVVVEVGTCTGITDELGLVRFKQLSIDKTGGYRLLAESSDLPFPDSPDAASVVSNLFHIHP